MHMDIIIETYSHSREMSLQPCIKLIIMKIKTTCKINTHKSKKVIPQNIPISHHVRQHKLRADALTTSFFIPVLATWHRATLTLKQDY